MCRSRNSARSPRYLVIKDIPKSREADGTRAFLNVFDYDDMFPAIECVVMKIALDYVTRDKERGISVLHRGIALIVVKPFAHHLLDTIIQSDTVPSGLHLRADSCATLLDVFKEHSDVDTISVEDVICQIFFRLDAQLICKTDCSSTSQISWIERLDPVMVFVKLEDYVSGVLTIDTLKTLLQYHASQKEPVCITIVGGISVVPNCLKVVSACSPGNCHSLTPISSNQLASLEHSNTFSLYLQDDTVTAELEDLSREWRSTYAQGRQQFYREMSPDTRADVRFRRNGESEKTWKRPGKKDSLIEIVDVNTDTFAGGVWIKTAEICPDGEVDGKLDITVTLRDDDDLGGGEQPMREKTFSYALSSR